MEKSFIDVRVFHPNAPTYKNKSTRQVYRIHEQQKKRVYNERVMQIEKASFTPIVMSTFGGMGDDANKFHKRLALLIAEKKNERYEDVLSYMRTRLRFCVLRSTLLSIRGIRGKMKKTEETTPISDVTYNLMRIE